MNKPVPLDSRGNQIHVGSFVCYTTNSRDSGLQFGEVFEIKERPSTRRVRNVSGGWERISTLAFKIIVLHTDAFGQPRYTRVWGDASQTHIATSIRSKSGPIEYSKDKFLIL